MLEDNLPNFPSLLVNHEDRLNLLEHQVGLLQKRMPKSKPRRVFLLLISMFLIAVPIVGAAASTFLVLQSQMKQAAFVVALPGLGLVPPSPPRPGQDEIRPLFFRPYQAGEQSAYLRDRQGYQRFIRTVAAPFSPCSIA